MPSAADLLCYLFVNALPVGQHLLVEPHDCLEVSDLGLQFVAPPAQFADAGIDGLPLDVHGGQRLSLLSELRTLLLQRFEALALGPELEPDVLEVRPGRLQVGQRLGLLTLGRLHVSELVTRDGQLLTSVLAFGFQFGDALAAVLQSGGDVVEGRKFVVDLSFLGLQPADLPAEFGGVHGSDDDFAEVVPALDGAPRLVVLEEEREEVGEFGVPEQRVAPERDGPVDAAERALVALVGQFEAHASLLGISFEGRAVAPDDGHHGLEEGGPVRRVPAREDVHAGGERDVRFVDTADVARV